MIDGLALGVLPEAAAAVRAKRPLVALIHHPLALETGLPAADADAIRGSERTALASASTVIVTSAPTARLLIQDYGVANAFITVARPGTERAPATRANRDGAVRLLSIGALVQRKGFDVLIAALATLTDLPWRLTIAGDRTRNPEVAARVDADITRLKLGDRVQVLGAVSDGRINTLYGESDVFVLASRFEGYGMAYAEALAHGLPVVGTTGGATPETVPPDAGILVEPDDVTALPGRCACHFEQPGARTYGRRRVDGRGGAADLAGIRQAVRRRHRGRGMSGFPPTGSPCANRTTGAPAI